MASLSQFYLYGLNAEVAGAKARIPFVGLGNADPLVVDFHEQDVDETISGGETP